MSEWAASAARTQRSAHQQQPTNLDGLYETAMRLQREGELDAALDAYSRVILADDEFGEAYYGRASVYYALGNCDQAINDCNRAIELRRYFWEAHLIRGAAYWGKAAECDPDDPLLPGYCEQVISDCTFVLDRQPRAALAYFNRGYALVFNADGAILRSSTDTAPGQTITARLGKGTLEAQVTDTKTTETRNS